MGHLHDVMSFSNHLNCHMNFNNIEEQKHLLSFKYIYIAITLCSR